MQALKACICYVLSYYKNYIIIVSNLRSIKSLSQFPYRCKQS